MMLSFQNTIHKRERGNEKIQSKVILLSKKNHIHRKFLNNLVPGKRGTMEQHETTTGMSCRWSKFNQSL